MRFIGSLIMSLAILLPATTSANEAAIEAMAEYLMFQEYESGIILPSKLMSLSLKLSLLSTHAMSSNLKNKQSLVQCILNGVRC